MNCPKCGAEIGGAGELCGECKTSALLQAGRSKAFRAAALPLGLLVSLIIGIIAIAFYFQYGLPSADFSYKQKFIAEKNALANKKAKKSRVKAKSLGVLRDGVRSRKIANSYSYVISDSNRIFLRIFVLDDKKESSSLFGELELGFNQNVLESCATPDKLVFSKFENGERIEILNREGQVAEGESKFQCSILSAKPQSEQGVPGNVQPPTKQISLSFNFIENDNEIISLEHISELRIIESAVSIKKESEGYFQLALWNARTGNLEVGFFNEKPSLEDLKQYQKQERLMSGAGGRPEFGVKIKTIDELAVLEPKGIKSYKVLMPRADDKDKSYIEFLSTVLPQADTEFIIKRGKLFNDGLVGFNLRDRELDVTKDYYASYSWDLKISAPILDVRNVPDAKLHEKIVSYSRSLPNTTGGIIHTDSSRVNIKDAHALLYEKSNTLSIALYNERLDAKDRTAINKAQTVWNAKQAAKPIAVVSFETFKDKVVISEITFMRSFLGDFYFGGSSDRVNFALHPSEIDESRLLFEMNSKNLRFKFREYSRSEAIGESFYWDLKVVVKPFVIK